MEVLWHLRFAAPLELPAVDIGDHHRRQARADEVLQRLADAGATVLDPAERLVDDSGHVIQVHQSRAIDRDTHHPSWCGAATFMRPLFAELSPA